MGSSWGGPAPPDADLTGLGSRHEVPLRRARVGCADEARTTASGAASDSVTSPPAAAAIRRAMASPRPDPGPSARSFPAGTRPSAGSRRRRARRRRRDLDAIRRASRLVTLTWRLANRTALSTTGLIARTARAAGTSEPGVGHIDREQDATRVDRLHDLGEDCRERAARRREHGRLVARQVEQCGDRDGHPSTGGDDLLEVRAVASRRQHVAKEHQVGRALDGRQGGAQLVGQLRRSAAAPTGSLRTPCPAAGRACRPRR